MLETWQIIIFWLIIDAPYFLYRLIELRFHTKHRKLETYPFISILIPAYNEEECIAKTIKSCLHQSYPNLEIIVIDDGSTDNTFKITKEFHQANIDLFHKKKIVFKLIHQENKGKAKALNTGLQKSIGAFIVTIDADSYLSTKAIETIMPYFIDETIGAVSGNIIGLSKHKILDYIQFIEYELGMQFLKKAQSVTSDIIVTPGAFSVYRHNALNKFEEDTITEDFDTSLNILEKNYKITAASNAICYTQLPLTISDLIKQRIRWQQGGLQVFTKHLFKKKRLTTHIEMFFVFFYSFYGIFPKIMSFVLVPVLFFQTTEIIYLIGIFLIYSSLIFAIEFLFIGKYIKGIKKYTYIPLFIIYYYTIILYSLLIAQIMIFKKQVEWSKLKRYRL